LFKALVLSSFVIGVAAWANHGYKILLEQIDQLVTSSYGSLSETDSPELRKTGDEITTSYFSYRANN
jgi:hypothetical protein